MPKNKNILLIFLLQIHDFLKDFSAASNVLRADLLVGRLPVAAGSFEESGIGPVAGFVVLDLPERKNAIKTSLARLSSDLT